MMLSQHKILMLEGEVKMLTEIRAALRTALRDVVSDVLEYERINNLAPNPGRKFCWDSVARAHAILGDK